MRKNTRLWIILAIAVVIAAGVGFVLFQPDTVSTPLRQDDAAQKDIKNDTLSETPTPTATVAKGAYTPYTQTSFTETPAERRVLFFHASWCPQCRALESDLTSKPLPDGVTIFKVDYDSHQDLRKKYGVTLQTTFVEVDSEGNKKQSYVAYDTPTLDAVTTALKL